MLLLCAALGAACGSGVEPEPPSEFRLGVLPTDFALGTVGPGNTVQLTVWSYDYAGAPTNHSSEAGYSSSAPGIAEALSGGLVTAVAPGTAEITATLTLGGITRTASMTVTVHDRDYSDIAGVYDLTAPITSYDDGLGYNLEGYRYTAVLTLQEKPGPAWLAGTYADLTLIGPGGDSTDVGDSGLVTGSVDVGGRVVIELLRDGNTAGLTLVVGTVAPGFIDGRFGWSGIVSGPFTAARR
jgi:hypothetical protein